MDDIIELLNQRFLGNTYSHFIWFAAFILLGIVFNRLLANLSGRIIYRLLKKSSHGVGIQKFYQMVRRPFRLLFMLIFIYIAFDYLKFPEEWHLAVVSEFGIRMLLVKVYGTVVISNIIWIFLKIIDFFGHVFKQRIAQEERPMNEQLISFAVDIIKITVLIFGIFIILGTVFEMNVGSIVAGLGIGGLAIALAAKETLENLFGSFTIFMDKPFVAGDLIQTKDITGTVEKTGFRSTRLRTVDKKFVTIPNKVLVDSLLINLTQRNQQRVIMNLYFNQKSPQVKIKQFMTELIQLVNAIEETSRECTVVFMDIEKNAYKLEVVYFVDSMDYTLYLSIKENVNFRIFELASTLELSFDFPEFSFNVK
jgi:MscS family membrane protein